MLGYRARKPAAVLGYNMVFEEGEEIKCVSVQSVSCIEGVLKRNIWLIERILNGLDELYIMIIEQ